ncbi:MAG: DUF86 domain-containing protein [Geobacter sp.]|nr:DUF86 domain-containing protein [Geobacter sp.]
MVDKEVVERLLGLLEEYLNDLESVQDVGFDEYKSAKQVRRFVERTLQIAIEACLDLGNHIIADEGLREPEDNKDVFKVLAEAGIIDAKLLGSLQPMASFRNLIVHDYGKIDDEIVFGILKRRLEDFREYSKRIVDHMRR